MKNADLWQRLEQALAPHRVEWHWVRSHAGHPENERATRWHAPPPEPPQPPWKPARIAGDLRHDALLSVATPAALT